MNPHLLEDEEVKEFRRTLADELGKDPMGDVDMVWCNFKGALKTPQSCLPLIPAREESDWMTDEVRKVSQEKQEVWMRWIKSPGNDTLKQEYQRFKVQSRKCVDMTKEKWWEAKAEKAEQRYVMVVRLGHGGSILKDLRLLKFRQKLKVNSFLYASDGTRLSTTMSKVERWREHFSRVSNVSVDVVDRVSHTVLEAVPDSEHVIVDDNSISGVPSEVEIRLALQLMKNGRAPGVDDISAELLKLVGETVVQWLSHLAISVWESEKVPEDWVRQLTIPLHKK